MQIAPVCWGAPAQALRTPLRLDSPEEVAAWCCANEALGLRSGAIVAVPNPEPMDADKIDALVETALTDYAASGELGGFPKDFPASSPPPPSSRFVCLFLLWRKYSFVVRHTRGELPSLAVTVL